MQGDHRGQSFKTTQALHRRVDMRCSPHRQASPFQDIIAASDVVAVKDLGLSAWPTVPVLAHYMENCENARVKATSCGNTMGREAMEENVSDPRLPTSDSFGVQRNQLQALSLFPPPLFCLGATYLQGDGRTAR